MSTRIFVGLVGVMLLIVLGVVTQLTHAPAPQPETPPVQAPSTDWAQPLRAHRAALPSPKPGDWLTEHDERGQTIAQYTASKPVRPSDQLTTIYVLPLGEFTAAERAVLDETVAFMGAFFCLPIRTLPTRSIDDFPAEARRDGVGHGTQLHVEYVLAQILKPTRPPDAIAYLALTATDLWPGKGWNFVYGMAYPDERLGIWSFRRNGDLATERAAFIERTFKIAVHETGHILGLEHCTAWACVMNGVNHREEADRAPLTLCPEDLVKLSWNTGCDPRTRLRHLQKLAKAAGLDAHTEYAQLLDQLGR